MSKPLLFPSVTGFAIQPERSAVATANMLDTTTHLCICYSPFGDASSRMDAECVEVVSGTRFSLEIMPGWVRVYYGAVTETTWDERVSARRERDEACKRIADDIRRRLGGQPFAGRPDMGR